MTTILDIDRLKQIAPISNALAQQVDMIVPFIEFAETAHLREDCLGEALYDSITSAIEAGNLSGHNKTLCESYLYNVSAWYSFWESSIFIMFRAEAKGVTVKFSDNSQPLSETQGAEWRQGILDKALFWRNACLKFLENNKTDYPLWRTQYYGKPNNDCDDKYGQSDYSGGIYV